MTRPELVRYIECPADYWKRMDRTHAEAVARELYAIRDASDEGPQELAEALGLAAEAVPTSLVGACMWTARIIRAEKKEAMIRQEAPRHYKGRVCGLRHEGDAESDFGMVVTCAECRADPSSDWTRRHVVFVPVRLDVNGTTVVICHEWVGTPERLAMLAADLRHKYMYQPMTGAMMDELRGSALTWLTNRRALGDLDVRGPGDPRP